VPNISSHGLLGLYINSSCNAHGLISSTVLSPYIAINTQYSHGHHPFAYRQSGWFLPLWVAISSTFLLLCKDSPLYHDQSALTARNLHPTRTSEHTITSTNEDAPSEPAPRVWLIILVHYNFDHLLAKSSALP
jgi:hypothetical protein